MKITTRRSTAHCPPPTDSKRLCRSTLRKASGFPALSLSLTEAPPLRRGTAATPDNHPQEYCIAIKP